MLLWTKFSTLKIREQIQINKINPDSSNIRQQCRARTLTMSQHNHHQANKVIGSNSTHKV